MDPAEWKSLDGKDGLETSSGQGMVGGGRLVVLVRSRQFLFKGCFLLDASP